MIFAQTTLVAAVRCTYVVVSAGQWHQHHAVDGENRLRLLLLLLLQLRIMTVLLLVDARVLFLLLTLLLLLPDSLCDLKG